jgi:hypothetical protein
MRKEAQYKRFVIYQDSIHLQEYKDRKLKEADEVISTEGVFLDGWKTKEWGFLHTYIPIKALVKVDCFPVAGIYVQELVFLEGNYPHDVIQYLQSRVGTFKDQKKLNDAAWRKYYREEKKLLAHTLDNH